MKFDPRAGKYVEGDNVPLGQESKTKNTGIVPPLTAPKPGAAVNDFRKRALALAASRQGK